MNSTPAATRAGKARPRQIEAQHQKALIQWAGLSLITPAPDIQRGATIADYLFAIPNGGRRDAITAAMLKAEGVKAGVSDLMLPIARRGHLGLFIELKAPDNANGESDSQREWRVRMQTAGYAAVCCAGWLQAREVLRWYLGHGSEHDEAAIAQCFCVRERKKRAKSP